MEGSSGDGSSGKASYLMFRGPWVLIPKWAGLSSSFFQYQSHCCWLVAICKVKNMGSCVFRDISASEKFKGSSFVSTIRDQDLWKFKFLPQKEYFFVLSSSVQFYRFPTVLRFQINGLHLRMITLIKIFMSLTTLLFRSQIELLSLIRLKKAVTSYIWIMSTWVLSLWLKQ